MVPARAERQDLPAGDELLLGVSEPPLRVEVLAAVEMLLVAIGGYERDHQPVARLDRHVVEGDLGRDAAGQAVHRREVAERLGRHALQEVAVLATLAERLPLVGMKRHVTEQAREHALRGLDAGGEEKRDGRDDLLERERLAVVLPRGQVGDQIAAGIAPALLDDRLEQLTELRERVERRFAEVGAGDGGDAALGDRVVPVPERLTLVDVEHLGDHQQRHPHRVALLEVERLVHRQPVGDGHGHVVDHPVEPFLERPRAADPLDHGTRLLVVLAPAPLQQRAAVDRGAAPFGQVMERLLILEDLPDVVVASQDPGVERLAEEDRMLLAQSGVHDVTVDARVACDDRIELVRRVWRDHGHPCRLSIKRLVRQVEPLSRHRLQPPIVCQTTVCLIYSLHPVSAALIH